MDVEQPNKLAEQLLEKEAQIHQIADTAYPSILKEAAVIKKLM